ncbi:MAG: type III pantothenate kinase [Nitrospirae bacterium]|nr:MAG: type III pantothenate kinase [Nitrospirota bacterium]
MHSSSILAIDIGNTHIVIGLFRNSSLQQSWRVATDQAKTADEYAIIVRALLATQPVLPSEISGCAISSVVPPLTAVFAHMVQTTFHCDPVIVTRQCPFGLTIRYQHPEEIGTDRLVNAAAAYARFRCALIIVDFGTATTFCTVTDKGEYLGGAIAPGLKSSADSLHLRTAKLPVVDLVRPKSVIGQDTISSIQSGVIYGYAGLVDELVSRIQQEIEQRTKVIATGGLATVIAPLSRTIDEYCPHLTLEGLELIYRRIFAHEQSE